MLQPRLVVEVVVVVVVQVPLSSGQDLLLLGLAG